MKGTGNKQAAGGSQKKSNKRSREERDALLAARRDETDEALEAAVFGLSAARKSSSHHSSSSAAASSRAAKPVSSAWHDEDDGNVQVDVAAVSRLRKLRHNPEESTLTGSDYAERLRKQFVKTVSGGAEVPDWAKLPSQRARRRRADSDDSASTNDDDDDQLRGDDEDGADHDAAAEEEDEAEAAVFRRAGGLTQQSTALPPTRLNITRVRDANRSEPSKAVIQSIGWHPSGAVMFSAGLDKKLRFFSIDGKRNPKVASVHFPDLPIISAAWNGDGSEVLLAGRRAHFYAYNVDSGAAIKVSRLLGCEEKSLESMTVSPGDPSAPTSCIAFQGNNGAIVLASTRTKQRIATLRMNGSVRALAFTREPHHSPFHTGSSYNSSSSSSGGGSAAYGSGEEYPHLLSVGGHGEVYRWDLRTMSCMGRHMDEGSTGSTALASTSDGRRYAVGSKSGVVNVYSYEDAAKGYFNTATSASADSGSSSALDFGVGSSSFSSSSGANSVRGLFASASNPAPLHRIMNITTPVDHLAYSPGAGAEMLAIGSDSVRDALKIVHTATGTVFANWPTSKTPLHYVTSVAFSPGCGYLSVGNDRGRVLLYRLNHFGSV